MLKAIQQSEGVRSAERERLRERLRAYLEQPTRNPLSHAQLNMWWLHRWAPDSAAYNQSVVFVMRGALDLDRLERALCALVARHEPLRSVYESMGDGVPVQRASPAQLSLERARLASDQAVRERLTREVMRPFDLTSDPALRALAIEVPGDVTVVLLVVHHIGIDGWSAVRVLTPELKSLYEGESLPPLPIQYSDFARWDQERASRGGYDASLKYWRERLDGAPPLTDLPTDRVRGAVQTFAGDRECLTIDADTFSAFERRCRELDTSLATGLLAALKLTLCRWAEQQDLVTGVVAANRYRPELERLLGNFIQFIPVRAQVARDASFTKVLAETSGALFEARAHEQCPFSLIVERARSQVRATGHNPVYNVALLLHRFPKSSTVENLGFENLDDETLREHFERYGARMGRPVTFGDLHGAMGWVDNASALLDLRFLVFPYPDGSALLECEYNTELFDADTAREALNAFATVLAQAGRAPGTRVCDFVGFDGLAAQRERARGRRTSSGETDDEAVEPPVPDDSPVYQLLRQIFADVLAQPEIGAQDNFFASGGDSMRALQALALIEEQTGLEMSVAVLNEHPNAARLYRYVTARLLADFGDAESGVLEETA